LNRIEEIKEEKQKLRNEMEKLLRTIIRDTERFRKNLPSPTKRALHTDFESTINIEEHESRIDNELELIQEKLAKLAA
jgi:hypothetical protein